MNNKLFSGRLWATLLLVSTYCIINLMIVHTANKLLMAGQPLGKDIVVFVIGEFTGTAIGAVIAYFFRTDRQPKDNKGA